jgi:hypothetical protein
MASSIPTFTKDASERLDYTVDWTAWLTGGDTIAAAPTWTVPAELTKDAQGHDSTRATVWLTGGVPGRTYTVECRITTVQGRIAERAFVLAVVDRR